LPRLAGRRRGSKPEKAMNTNGARETPGEPREGMKPINERPPGAIEATHDLLVMSLRPEGEHAGRSNHACLNSFRSSSWIMPAGGRPKTMVGL
jgi:hypothetical protein